MTNWFDRAFEGGFYLNLVSFLFTIYVEPFYFEFTQKETIVKMSKN